MFRLISKNKAWMGYALYGAVFSGILLYLSFPSDLLRNIIETRIDRMDSGLAFSMDRINLSFPPGLVFSQPKISLKERREAGLFSARKISVRPEFWPLLRGNLRCFFWGNAYKGEFDGRARLKEGRDKPEIEAETECKEISVGDLEYPRELLGRQVSGKLFGRITYNGKLSRLERGRLEANLIIKDGSLEYLNLHPLIRIEPIDFSKLELDLALEGREINLTKVKLTGPQFNGTLSGIMNLGEEFWNSGIELKGNVRPSVAFFKGLEARPDVLGFIKQQMKRGSLSFSISGTLREPRVTFR